MICLKCLSMFSLYMTTQGAKGKHHANEAHLDRAATAGCKICTYVRREWLQEKRNLRTTSAESSSSASFNYQINLDEERGSASIFFLAEVPYLTVDDQDDDDDNEVAVTSVNVYRSASLPDQEACSKSIVQQSSSPSPEELRDEPWRVRHVGSLRTYPDSTGHPAVAEQASRWLEQCLASHETCRLAALNGGDWYPQRLLDVRDPCRPRLVITAQAQPPVSGGYAYATLSHCWGEHPEFMVLCPQTEELLMKGVPVERLPQTFRDAVLTTNRLGIDYLWIDSLCIQQAGPGSADDWVGHVKAMRRIYQRCVLNIAVDRAGSPGEGAFVRRSSDAAALQGCQVFWDTGRGGDRGDNMWTVVDDRDLNGGFFAAPLTRRAWVFQERFLAPRVLHFGAEQVWWECAELGFASEVMPQGMARAHPLFDLAGAPFCVPRAPLPLPDGEPSSEMEEENIWRDTIMNEWQRAVATYAKARLTFVEKDVFAAFAGVAELFASNFYPDDEYLAGHFRSELPWCLLWECEGMRRPPKGDNPYRAPSWSWASMSNSAANVTDDTVGLPLWHACPDDLRQQDAGGAAAARVLAAVLDARVELVDEGNRFGAVRYAEITMRVKAFECFRLDNHPALKRGDDGDEEEVDPAAPKLNPSRVPHAKARPTSWGVGRAVAAVAAPELFERHPYTRPFLTPYVEVEPDDEEELLGLGRALAVPILDDRGAGRVMGILVWPVVGRDGGGDGRSYFKRVGGFRVKSFDVDELVRRGVVGERDVVLV